MLRSSAVRILLSILVLAVVISATFAETSRNRFVDWDDRNEIFGNVHFNPVTTQGIAWNWAHTQLTLYMPITYMVWGAVASVAPRDANGVLEPAAFHFLNVLLHLTCSILVFFLLRQLWHRDGPALVGSLLFAVHPLQAEPVSWASGMYTLLSACLCLGALIAYVAHVNRIRTEARRHFPTLFLLATLLYLLALFSKAASASLPLVAATVDLLVLRRPFNKVFRSLVAWIILAIPIVQLAKLFQDLTNVPVPPWWGRPLVALDAIGFYAKKVILPVALIPDYGRTPAWGRAHPAAVAVSVGIAIVALLVAYAVRRRAVWVTAGIGVFIAGVSPYLGLTTFDFQYVSTVADRYAYFGMLGVAMLACGAAIRERGAMVILIVVAVFWATATHSQTRWWHDTDTLFAHTLRINPRSLISHNVLGYEAAHRGRPLDAERWYEGALAIWPADATIWFNLGNLHIEKDPARAAGEYRQAVRYLPGNPAFRKNLASALARMGSGPEAIDQYRAAISADSSDPDTHYGLGTLLEQYGDQRAAREEYETVLRLDPGHAGAVNSLHRLASPR